MVGSQEKAAYQGTGDSAAQGWPGKDHRLLFRKDRQDYDATVVLEDDGRYANFKLEFDRQKGGAK